MNYEFRELRGSTECDFHRQHQLGLTKVISEPQQKAAVTKRIIKDALDGLIPYADVPAKIREEFAKFSYKSAEQAALKTNDTIQEVMRFLNGIAAMKATYGAAGFLVNTAPVKKDITVTVDGEDMTVKNVCPDLIVRRGASIVAVMLRIGKPVDTTGRALSDANIATDKSLYFLLKYAEDYADQEGLPVPGQTIECEGAYWFLRKKTDRRSLNLTGNGDKSHFDKSFFFDEKMNQTSNVVSLSEGYMGSQNTAPSQTDQRMHETLSKFIDGYTRDECTEAQCKDCVYDCICHYTHAPQALETEEKPIDLSLVKLSPVQEQIKDFHSGYAVVNAGPGSGKTFTLCFNATELMLAGAKPEEILLIVFSHSAAQVFRDRIAVFNDDIGTGEDISGMRIVTFNEFGQEVLQDTYQRFGFSKPPRVIQPVERFGIIERLLNAHSKIPDLDYRNFETNMKNCKGPLAVASLAFQVIKSKGYSSLDGAKIAKSIGTQFCTEEAATELAKLYGEYDAYLKANGLVEFADQEVLLLQLLREDPYYFDQLGLKHILVDEAQDTSSNQFEILRYLAMAPTFESMMIVGDDSQSIYKFRDADPEGFMAFESRMQLPEGTVRQFYMMDNFRSTPQIVGFANKIIEYNKVRVDKRIISQKPDGAPVEVKGFYDKTEEYDYIVKSIKEKLDAGTAPEDIAFIASSRTELMRMADLLTEQGIPSVLLNPERLKENSRVLAGLALARYLQDPSDTQDILVCLNAIFSGDLFVLSDEQIKQAIANKQAEAAIIRQMPEDQKRQAFFDTLALFDEDDEIYEGFVETLQNQPSMAMVFQYCNDFNLYGDREEKRRENAYPGVVLTTAHSSKGMEWDIVFNSLTKYDEKEIHTRESYRNSEAAEERRRLLFVSATRAKKELHLTGLYAAYGSAKEMRLNIFLEEAFQSAGYEYKEGEIRAAIAARKKELAEKRKEAKKMAQDEIVRQATKMAMQKQAKAS